MDCSAPALLRPVAKDWNSQLTRELVAGLADSLEDNSPCAGSPIRNALRGSILPGHQRAVPRHRAGNGSLGPVTGPALDPNLKANRRIQMSGAVVSILR